MVKMIVGITAMKKVVLPHHQTQHVVMMNSNAEIDNVYQSLSSVTHTLIVLTNLMKLVAVS
jgi:hypothetical protein